VQVLNLTLMANLVAEAIFAAAEFGLADGLKDDSATSAELAVRTGVHQGAAVLSAGAGDPSGRGLLVLLWTRRQL
jgi:hypothetical protein